MVLRTSAAFNRSVWFYDWLAQLIFGGAIRQSQIQILSFIPAHASVLIVGGGTGWILQEIALLKLPLEITYLELSSSMLVKAGQVAGKLSSDFLKISLRQGTEADLQPNESFDVIFTPFVLDLYSDAQVLQMVNTLQVHLKTGGLWLLADFFISPELRGWPKWWRSGITKIMYTFFSWVENLKTSSLPNIPLQFQKFHMLLLYNKPFFQGFIQAQVYKKLTCS